MLWVARIVLAIGLLGLSLFARLLELMRPEGGRFTEPLPPEELLQAEGQGIDFGLFLAALIVLVVGGLAIFWLFRAVQRNYRRVSAQRASRSLLGHLLLVLRALLASILGLFGWTRTVARALGASVMALAGRRGSMRANLAAMRREGGGSVAPATACDHMPKQWTRRRRWGCCGRRQPRRASTGSGWPLAVPGATAAVDGLTDMYMAARYAPELGPDHEVERARRLQADVARALQAPPHD